MKLEAIVAIEADKVPKHEGESIRFHKNDSQTLATMESGIVLAQRERLESEPAYRQIIPYCALMGWDGRVLVYLRTTKSNESRLVDQVSIGIGGHMDAVDILYGNGKLKPLVDAVEDCAVREIDEEIDLTDDQATFLKTEVAGFIVGNVGVHQVHVAVAIVATLPDGTDVDAIEANEDTLDIVGWMEPSEVIDAHDAGEFEVEGWSMTFLRDYLASDHDQMKAAG